MVPVNPPYFSSWSEKYSRHPLIFQGHAGITVLFPP
jgi:hypothetical protein